MRILLIEDNELNRDMLTRRLERKGYSVISAGDGLSGIEKAGSEKPELILLDLLMPVMDGFEFLKIIKANDIWGNIPIIVITSKDLTADDYSFLTSNVDKVIKKGEYTRKEIITRIDTAIKESNLKMYMKGN